MKRDPPLLEVTSRKPTVSEAAGRCVCWGAGGGGSGRRGGEGAAGQTARAAVGGGSEWLPDPRASSDLPPRPLAQQGIEPAHDISCDQLLVYLVDLGDPRSSWNVGRPQINV